MRTDGLAAAVLLSLSMRFGQVGGVHLEIGVRAGEAGAEFSNRLFRDVEMGAAAGKTYRGRVISLECYDPYSGCGGPVRVHRLHRSGD